MNRRTALLLLGAASVGGVTYKTAFSSYERKTPEIPAFKEGKMVWRNWSGNQICYPENRHAPKDEAELKSILQTSNNSVRMVGSGHSFSGLVPTETTLISLDRMGGVKSVDQEAGEAVLGAGGKLVQLAPELAKFGVAFSNLPDINKQSLAGAIATATHGSGKAFSSMSDDVRFIRIMLADGEVITCSREENTDLFKAAQVSLGALGVVTEIGYQVEPSFNLRRSTWVEDYKSLTARVPSLIDKHRAFEFFYIPFTGECLAITHDKTDLPASITPESDDNDSILELKKLRDKLAWIPPIRRRIGKSAVRKIPTETVIDASWKLLSNEREVRFNEMEYHLPADSALKVLDEVVERIERHHKDVFFPIEVRYIKGDAAWLSPFEGGDRMSIAVHAYYKDDFRALFTDIEPILRRGGGRPHWGKMNTLKASEFKGLYGNWDKFTALRKEVDPTNKFLNPYLKGVFGVES